MLNISLGVLEIGTMCVNPFLSPAYRFLSLLPIDVSFGKLLHIEMELLKGEKAQASLSQQIVMFVEQKVL